MFWLQERGVYKPGLEPNSSRDDKRVFCRTDASRLLCKLGSVKQGPELEAAIWPCRLPLTGLAALSLGWSPGLARKPVQRLLRNPSLAGRGPRYLLSFLSFGVCLRGSSQKFSVSGLSIALLFSFPILLNFLKILFIQKSVPPPPITCSSVTYHKVNTCVCNLYGGWGWGVGGGQDDQYPEASCLMFAVFFFIIQLKIVSYFYSHTFSSL